MKIINFLKKAILYTLLTFIIVILLTAFIVPRIFPLTKVVNFAAAKAGEQVGRTISIKKASFNPFKGVSLQGVVISNDAAFSTRPMIEIKEVVLSYQILPLIFERRVVVGKAGIDGLSLLFEQKGKVNNFSSLAGNKVKASAGKKSEAGQALSGKDLEKQVKQAIDFNVGKIFLANSNIEYINYLAKTKTLKINNVNLAITNISKDLKYSPANIQGSLKLIGGTNTSKVELSGKLTGVTAANLELKIDKLAGDELLAVFTNLEPQGNKKPKNTQKTKEPAQELILDFSPLAGYDLDFVATLDQFTWARIKVEKIKFKLGLHDLVATFSHESDFYQGRVSAEEKSELSLKPANYTVLADVHKIDGRDFLDKALDIENAIEGLMSATVTVDGKLNFPSKFNGSASVLFENGKVKDAGKILPGLPKEITDKLFADLNGKAFDLLKLELGFKNGQPTVGALKAKGPQLDIDQNFNLDLGKVQEQVQQEVDQAKAKVQAELDKQKSAAEDAVKDQLKGLFPGQQ